MFRIQSWRWSYRAEIWGYDAGASYVYGYAYGYVYGYGYGVLDTHMPIFTVHLQLARLVK